MLSWADTNLIFIYVFTWIFLQSRCSGGGGFLFVFCVLATRNNCRHFWHRGILAAAAAVGLTLVVSEGVSQEDEDKYDTECGKG